MATTCKLDLSAEEEKQYWIHSIQIPYEINHDFFMMAWVRAKNGELDWIPAEDLFSFPDYWRWIVISWNDIDLLLEKLNKFEGYIDTILNFIEIPQNISLHDSRVIVWYESFYMYDESSQKWFDNIPYSTYAITYDDSYFHCEKKDIVYIINLLKKLLIKANGLGKWVKFEWE